MVQLCNDHYRMPGRLFANFIGTLVHPPPLNRDAVMLSAVLKLVEGGLFACVGCQVSGASAV